RSLSPAQRLLTGEALAGALAELGGIERGDLCPRDGLVLSVVCKDLPRGPGPGPPPGRNPYNLDYAWFRKGEARAFVPGRPGKGARQDVRRDLVERLACFHLVDVVRGHTAPFPRQAVERAALTAEVVDVKGDLVSLSYRGRTRTSEVHDG